jgi:hypothetical protein
MGQREVEGCQVPIWLQVWGVWLSPHLFSPGLQSAHSPVPMQLFGQGASASQVPTAVQWAGVLFGPHLREPEVHEPPHDPAEQSVRQGVPSTQVPSMSQVCGVRLFGPPQASAPGLQVPPHTPCPMQALGHGVPRTHVP